MYQDPSTAAVNRYPQPSVVSRPEQVGLLFATLWNQIGEVGSSSEMIKAGEIERTGVDNCF